MAWHCENMYGCFLLLVWDLVSHCRAVQSLVVATSMLTDSGEDWVWVESRLMIRGLP